MNIQVNDHNIELFFDNGGNFYFKCSDEIYDLSISSNNKLDCDICKIDEINNSHPKNIKLNNLKLTMESNSLKGQIQRDINKKKSTDEPNNIDDIENEENDYYNHLYENHEFTDFNSVNSDDENDHNESVKFLSCGIDINIYDFDNIIALYDTLIYNDDPEHGSLCFKTSLVNINPCYRLKIYKNGTLSFRAIGDKEEFYKLIIEDNKLSLSVE